MKVKQFREMLQAAEQFYRDAGNTKVASSLKEIATLMAERDALTVSALAGLIEKALATQADA